ncbi:MULTISPECIES: protein TolQ [Corallincola]|uniref:Tol-Pal system protein TolQ n=3 Tax=Corallincola TaxID=1775176 RepID=A0A368NG57_9GAMM|nr:MULTISPECIES: protein TolQ [Corallincola]RCU49448.1 protein TolQ [Corallincola holothuriorum]TAA47736.1 protein TolQ [Corallincola spongiicola]TCI01511.1 protein TolQ [Corallincola luteus]
MSTEISFLELIFDASLLVQLVMLILLAMSVLSWGMIFQRAKALKEAQDNADRFEDRFWSGVDLNKLYQEVSARSAEAKGMEQIFKSGFKEFARYHQGGSYTGVSAVEGTDRAMRVALSREVDELEQHLPFMATVGSISPYIGLFGTVWGIMNAFVALGSMNQAQLTLSLVAPAIAEALIATAMGLFAAIPAVIAYNKFSHQVERLENSYGNFMEEFSSILHRQSVAREQE